MIIMLEEKTCQAGGIHNYHESMATIANFDIGLSNFIGSRIPHYQWHQMIHTMMSERRPLYRRMVKVFEAMERQEHDMVNEDGSPVATLAAGWDVANELAATYRCDMGFTEKPASALSAAPPA